MFRPSRLTSATRARRRSATRCARRRRPRRRRVEPQETHQKRHDHHLRRLERVEKSAATRRERPTSKTRVWRAPPRPPAWRRGAICVFSSSAPRKTSTAADDDAAPHPPRADGPVAAGPPPARRRPRGDDVHDALAPSVHRSMSSRRLCAFSLTVPVRQRRRRRRARRSPPLISPLHTSTQNSGWQASAVLVRAIARHARIPRADDKTRGARARGRVTSSARTTREEGWWMVRRTVRRSSTWAEAAPASTWSFGVAAWSCSGERPWRAQLERSDQPGAAGGVKPLVGSSGSARKLGEHARRRPRRVCVRRRRRRARERRRRRRGGRARAGGAPRRRCRLGGGAGEGGGAGRRRKAGRLFFSSLPSRVRRLAFGVRRRRVVVERRAGRRPPHRLRDGQDGNKQSSWSHEPDAPFKRLVGTERLPRARGRFRRRCRCPGAAEGTSGLKTDVALERVLEPPPSAQPAGDGGHQAGLPEARRGESPCLAGTQLRTGRRSGPSSLSRRPSSEPEAPVHAIDANARARRTVPSAFRRRRGERALAVAPRVTDARAGARAPLKGPERRVGFGPSSERGSNPQGEVGDLHRQGDRTRALASQREGAPCPKGFAASSRRRLDAPRGDARARRRCVSRRGDARGSLYLRVHASTAPRRSRSAFSHVAPPPTSPRRRAGPRALVRHGARSRGHDGTRDASARTSPRARARLASGNRQASRATPSDVFVVNLRPLGRLHARCPSQIFRAATGRKARRRRASASRRPSPRVVWIRKRKGADAAARVARQFRDPAGRGLRTTSEVSGEAAERRAARWRRQEARAGQGAGGGHAVGPDASPLGAATPSAVGVHRGDGSQSSPGVVGRSGRASAPRFSAPSARRRLCARDVHVRGRRPRARASRPFGAVASRSRCGTVVKFSGATSRRARAGRAPYYLARAHAVERAERRIDSRRARDRRRTAPGPRPRGRLRSGRRFCTALRARADTPCSGSCALDESSRLPDGERVPGRGRLPPSRRCAT